jgi:hypothetical protein
MAVKERRSGLERRSGKDRRSGVDTRTEEQRTRIGSKNGSLFDHLVGASEDALRNAHSPRFIERSPTDRLSGHSGNPALRRLSV